MRTWTKVGEEIVGSPVDEGTILTRAIVERAINNLDWIEIPKGGKLEVAAMPGLNISAAIQQFPTSQFPATWRHTASTGSAPITKTGMRKYSSSTADRTLLRSAQSSL
jgi:hypothetical protein